MVATSFPQALKFVLAAEGGNDDDPADHGGRTSRGITQKEYDAWCEEQNLPQGDVWKASQTEIEEIYHSEYWNPYCDGLPVGVDYLFFDLAVNGGPHEAALMLQRALDVTADGRIGPVTRQTAAKASPRALILRFTASKRAWYLSLHQPKFTKGWLNRTNEVQANALSMVP